MTNEYPDEEILKQIEAFPINRIEDCPALLEFVKPHWRFADWGWREDKGVYHISTGGWSGNEDIIYALKKNTMFWMMFWEQSRRGGHYIFSSINNVIKELS